MGAGPVQFLHFLILGDGYMIFKEEFQVAYQKVYEKLKNKK